MNYSTQDVTAMLEELKGHDDVIGHASVNTNNPYLNSVAVEDSGPTVLRKEDLGY